MSIEWSREALNFLSSLFAISEESDFQTVCEQATELVMRHAHADAATLLHLEDRASVRCLTGWPQTPLSEGNDADWLAGITNDNVIQIGQVMDGQCQMIFPIVDENFKGAFVIRIPRRFLDDVSFGEFTEHLWLGLKKTLRLGNIYSSTLELRARFTAILETIPQGIVFIDNDGRHAWTNVRGTEFLRLSQETNEPIKIAKAMQALRSTAVNADDILRKGFELFSIQNQSVRDWIWLYDNPVTQVLNVASTPLATERIGGRLWVFTDVTEKYLARKSLEQLNAELVEKSGQADRANKAKSEFLSSMSHELRTPLNAILGFGQLLKFDKTLSSHHQEWAHEILKAGNHLLELINEVLDLSKIEAGHVDLSLEPVEVLMLIDECVALIRPLADKRNISVTHACPSGQMVRADRTRLKQVLLNLMSNAIKYNREGGSIRISMSPSAHDMCSLAVTDTGLGIPPERMNELFQPFSRLGATASSIEGTGIGLTITRRMVEAMNGSVDVESKVGEGSTFWVELPQAALMPVAGLEDEKNGDCSTLKPTGLEAQHTVLYIEDNPANLRLVAQILTLRPHVRLLTAHTPELGIAYAQADRPDLVLLDINMPGMNGFQVLEILKADRSLKFVPVIAVSANAMARDMERGEAAGFSAYVTKPINMDLFLDTVDHYLSA